MKKTLVKSLTAAVLALSSALAFAGDGTANSPFKVGAMSGKESALVYAAKEVAKKKFGLNVEVVLFDDYVTPNIALAEGEIDANAYQHRPYLNAMNKDRGFDLVPVGDTFVYPIGAYSKKIKNIKELKDGATIAIPNDPSNEARTLILLDKKGLIKLKDPNNLQASVLDIVSNPHHYQFQEVDAAQLPRTLDDVDLAFINSGYAVDAGLTPTKDAIIREGNDSPYVNVIAVRKGDENKKAVKEFVEAYHSQPVIEAAEKAFKGAAVKGWK